MAKRLKLKLSRVIPSFLICRSRNPAALAETPVSVTHRLSPFNPKALDISYPSIPGPPPSTPQNPTIKRHMSRRNIISVDYECPSRSCSQDPCDCSINSSDFSWNNEVKPQAKPHGKAHMYPVTVNENTKKNKSFSLDDSGCFSIEAHQENEETEALLFPSRSFSYDSSYEFTHSVETITEKSDDETEPGNKKAITDKKKIRRLRRQVSRNLKSSPLRTSVLRRMISTCKVGGKVRESVVVVKKSEDPYEDFKRSMLEMILEKQIFEASDLEELLQCFLSLNSRQYHGVIVEAFTEIWDIVFCDSPVKKRASFRG